eukprot:213838-Heterocapsa_arctica.AAC.1
MEYGHPEERTQDNITSTPQALQFWLPQTFPNQTKGAKSTGMFLEHRGSDDIFDHLTVIGAYEDRGPMSRMQGHDQDSFH